VHATPHAVVLINAFEVPREADEPFIMGWERARDFLAGTGGFSATALRRALRDDADFRFVKIVYPRSETALARNAGPENETDDAAEAYAPFPHWRLGRPEAWAALPWA
jgi:hypothetical protein